MEVESSTSDTISPMIGAAAMDSYYVLRCHRHIKFISLHSSPSKKCRFSNARMTSGRAGAPPLLCPIHVVVCLARAVREWLPCMEVQDFKADSRDDVRVRPGQRRRRSAERINANGSSPAPSLILALLRAQGCVARAALFCCVKRAEENEINHIQARERRTGCLMPEAQSKRQRWQAAAVQRVKSSVLNDAHIDKWMAHPLLLLPPRLCLASSSSQGKNSSAP